MIAVFTTINATFHASAELQLAYGLFRHSLPADSHVHLLTQQQSLTTAISDYLQQDNPAEYCLISRNAWLLWGENSVQDLLQQLTQQPDLACVLPNQPVLSPPTVDNMYYTQRGFEHYIHNLPQQLICYQEHSVVAFLIRTQALAQLWTSTSSVFALPAQCGDKTKIYTGSYVHPAGDYYDHPRDEIIELIPQHTQTVLDIGCATGHFGAELKRQRGCQVTGLELNPIAAQQAGEKLDKVWLGNALDIELNQRFDVVTCLDSLEHFTQPSDLLQRIQRDFLKPQGHFIASIPNVGHWSVVLDLLAGRWDYVPFGLLCETHYRFYTLHSIKNLLQSHGFAIIELKTEIGTIPEQVLNKLKSLQQQGVSVDFASLEVMTYHLLARKI